MAASMSFSVERTEQAPLFGNYLGYEEGVTW